MSNEGVENKTVEGVPLAAGALISFGIGWLSVSLFGYFVRRCVPWIREHPLAFGVILLILYALGLVGRHFEGNTSAQDLCGIAGLILIVAVVLPLARRRP